jgi:hypothetical protein
MKALVGRLLLVAVGVALGFVGALMLHGKRPVATRQDKGEFALAITATIDGSDRFVFTRDNVWNEHGRWQPPQRVLFNNEPWLDISVAPANWSELSKDLDLTRARIVQRKARDIIALEPTAEGFDLYFADTHMGADLYEVTIAIPRK